MQTIGKAILGSLLLLTAATGFSADRASDVELAKALQNKMDFAYGTVLASGDAQRFADELIDRDFVASGSDGPGVARGPKDRLSVAQDIIKTYSAIKAKAVWTRVLGPNAACQFVLFELTPREPGSSPNPVVAKSLFVWVKTSKGWRIAADHYSYAGIDWPK